jgi:hypothetical protein
MQWRKFRFFFCGKLFQLLRAQSAFMNPSLAVKNKALQLFDGSMVGIDGKDFADVFIGT